MANGPGQFIDPHAHQGFLGKHFVDNQDYVVLRIGNREWTRLQLVQDIGVGHIAAAGKLSTVLRKAGVRSMEDLYAVNPRELALVRGLGETTVYVAMALLKKEGFDVSRWYQLAEGAKKRVVTFRSMKLWSEKERGGRKRRSA